MATQPRYVGTDESGDQVWELPDGRWSWGSTAKDAAERGRSFTPEDYVAKYGEPDKGFVKMHQAGEYWYVDLPERTIRLTEDEFELLSRAFMPHASA